MAFTTRLKRWKNKTTGGATAPDYNLNEVNMNNMMDTIERMISVINDVFQDVVLSGGLEANRTGLQNDVTACVAYAKSNRVQQSAGVVGHVYTALKDTYVHLNTTNGEYSFNEVANLATAPTVASTDIAIMKVVTDATAITGVTDLANRSLKTVTNLTISDTSLATISTAGKVSDTALSTNVALKDVANAFTKTQTWAKGADVASAAALTLGDGNYFDVTGTATVTSIATKGIGTQVTLHFDGVLTLTHHATDLVLPDGANVTTTAGDEITLVEYATGDWRMIGSNRQRFSQFGTNTGAVTLTTPVKNILVSLNMGTVNVGDIIHTTWFIDRASKGVTAGDSHLFIDTTGTASIVIGANLDPNTKRLAIFPDFPANEDLSDVRSLLFRVTGAGTLTLILKGTSEGSDTSVAVNEAQFHAIILKNG